MAIYIACNGRKGVTMNSRFWNSIDLGNYTLCKRQARSKGAQGRHAGGVVAAVIGVDIPVTTIQALKDRIHCRIIERLQSGESRTVDEPKGE